MGNILESIMKDIDSDRTFEKEDVILEPLSLEIALIDDEGISQLVRSVLCRMDERFWEAPATTNQGEHPPDEYQDGGGIINIQRVTRIAAQMGIAYAIDQKAFDILIASCLLHSITKTLQISDGTFYTDPFYPYTVEGVIAEMRMTDEKLGNDSHSTTLLVEPEDLKVILRLIRCQRGQWSIVQETIPETMLEWIMHLATLLAMNLHHMVDGYEIEEWRWLKDPEAEL